MPFDNQRPARIHRAGRPGVPTFIVTVNAGMTADDIARRKARFVAQIMGGSGRRTVRVTFDHANDVARADECIGEYPLKRVCSWTERGFVEDFAGLYAAALGLPLSRVDA